MSNNLMSKQNTINYFNHHKKEILEKFPRLQSIVDKIVTQPQLAHAANILAIELSISKSANSP